MGPVGRECVQGEIGEVRGAGLPALLVLDAFGIVEIAIDGLL